MAFVQVGTRISKKDAEYLDKLITEGYAVSRSDAIRLIIAERADLDKKRKAITPLSPSPKRSSRRKKYTFHNLVRVTYDINGVRYENGIRTDRNISSTPIYEKKPEEEEGIDLGDIELVNVYVDSEGVPIESENIGIPAENLPPDLSDSRQTAVPDPSEISEESEREELEESAEDLSSMNAAEALGSSEEAAEESSSEKAAEALTPPKLSEESEREELEESAEDLSSMNAAEALGSSEEAAESPTPSKKSPRDYFGFKAQHDDSMFEGWTEAEIRDYKQKFGLD